MCITHLKYEMYKGNIKCDYTLLAKDNQERILFTVHYDDARELFQFLRGDVTCIGGDDLMELHIEFNPTIGKLLIYTEGRTNVEECNLDYFSDLGEVIQSYANEHIRDRYLNSNSDLFED